MVTTSEEEQWRRLPAGFGGLFTTVSVHCYAERKCYWLPFMFAHPSCIPPIMAWLSAAYVLAWQVVAYRSPHRECDARLLGFRLLWLCVRDLPGAASADSIHVRPPALRMMMTSHWIGRENLTFRGLEWTCFKQRDHALQSPALFPWPRFSEWSARHNAHLCICFGWNIFTHASVYIAFSLAVHNGAYGAW